MVIIMKVKEFVGSTVLDINANVVGKIDDVDFDPKTGKIDDITLNLQTNLFSKDEVSIKFDDIQTIGAYVILNKEITKTVDEPETVEVEIDEEDE